MNNLNDNNKNLPRLKGKAEPIRNFQDIKKIRKYLQKTPRNLLLFDLLTQTGMQIKYALNLKVKDISGLIVGDSLPPIQNESNFNPVISKTMYQSFQNYLKKSAAKEEDYLFQSRKGSKPLNVSSVSNMINHWFEMTGFSGLCGGRSLRKTWQMHFKKNNKIGSEEILKPVNLPTLQEEVYRQLLQAILSAKIRPGERLITEELAKHFQVSPIPVREAISRLEAAGFVSSIKKGVRTASLLSKGDLEEILEIRLTLETMAAKLSARQVSDDTLVELENIFQELSAATIRGDVVEVIRLNKLFHLTLYRDAKKNILHQIINSLIDKVSPHFHILYYRFDKQYVTMDIETHRKMLEGMQLRDPKKVCKWLKIDMTDATRRLIKMFEEMKGPG
jgi:DNA-binding GntR family transcriptional regulator